MPKHAEDIGAQARRALGLDTPQEVERVLEEPMEGARRLAGPKDKRGDKEVLVVYGLSWLPRIPRRKR